MKVEMIAHVISLGFVGHNKPFKRVNFGKGFSAIREFRMYQGLNDIEWSCWYGEKFTKMCDASAKVCNVLLPNRTFPQLSQTFPQFSPQIPYRSEHKTEPNPNRWWNAASNQKALRCSLQHSSQLSLYNQSKSNRGRRSLDARPKVDRNLGPDELRLDVVRT